MPKHVLVLDLVCLTLDHLKDRAATPNLCALAERSYAASLTPPLPAVTCIAQATLTTGTASAEIDMREVPGIILGLLGHH